jgi:hypothetical protein
MKFILGLIFGMAVTFTGAWLLAHAQSPEPAEQPAPLQKPEIVQHPATETLSSHSDDKPTAPAADAPQMPLATTVIPVEIEAAELTAPIAHTEQGSEPVWTLFHSEASASGFANYLSTSLDHPFEVTKLGPAQYQVSYSYTNPEQAQALAAKINTITGAK